MLFFSLSSSSSTSSLPPSLSPRSLLPPPLTHARAMTVHQLWRFPQCGEDLSALRGSSLRPPVSSEEIGCFADLLSSYHSHSAESDRCSSVVVQRIHAPLHSVWSVVRRFDNPQAYKRFIRSCFMYGDGQVGSTREIEVVSGLPASNSTERLEILDEEKHILSFKIVGGQHRLCNYHSVTTLHEFETDDGKPGTMVIESYVVDVPDDNTVEETRFFTDTIVKYNLRSLARVSEVAVR